MSAGLGGAGQGLNSGPRCQVMTAEQATDKTLRQRDRGTEGTGNKMLEGQENESS